MQHLTVELYIKDHCRPLGQYLIVELHSKYLCRPQRNVSLLDFIAKILVAHQGNISLLEFIKKILVVSLGNASGLSGFSPEGIIVSSVGYIQSRPKDLDSPNQIKSSFEGLGVPSEGTKLNGPS